MKLAPRLEVSKSDCTAWKPLKAEYSCQLTSLTLVTRRVADVLD